MGLHRRSKVSKAQRRGWMADHRRVLIGRERQAAGIVQPLHHQPFTQRSISLGIRSALKDMVNSKIRLPIPYGTVDISTILKQEEITEKWGRKAAEPTLAIGGPCIGLTADRFLGTVVKVVAERRSDLRFELYSQHQLVTRDNEQISLLLGTEVTW